MSPDLQSVYQWTRIGDWSSTIQQMFEGGSGATCNERKDYGWYESQLQGSYVIAVSIHSCDRHTSTPLTTISDPN